MRQSPSNRAAIVDEALRNAACNAGILDTRWADRFCDRSTIEVDDEGIARGANAAVAALRARFPALFSDDPTQLLGDQIT